ncbi:PQ loop repeat protein-like protein [Setomelanomma holmii]|uniref:PQ loop repeat protein-like protein n=1 Tax=Setomelanomma holmii TaxID=210430 RepID=A0A9P4GZ73_9PLEO|nr:PQ loop repeat protein-like protein [Setomelanomma holmii]
MGPQDSIPVAANVLGTIGTVCWCVQLFPQIWRNYRAKNTEGLPPAMMLIWSMSGVPFGVYAVAQKFNTPLIIQPQCFCVLCGVSWAQCLIYGRKWRTWTATLLFIALLIIFAGIEVGLIFAIRPAYSKGIEWPVLTVGIIAFVTLISGYLPIPFELLKRRGRVVGIDFVFLTIDWCGAFFSLLALVAQNEFDVLFGTMYALCCTIEMSMVASHLIWLFRTRHMRKRAKDAGMTFDEYDECVSWQAKGINLEKKFSGLFKMNAARANALEQEVESDSESVVVPERIIPKIIPNVMV